MTLIKYFFNKQLNWNLINMSYEINIYIIFI